MSFSQSKRLFRSVILGLILFMSSHVGLAQWNKITSSNERGGYIIYTDPSLSLAFDGVVNFWLLYDFMVLQKVKSSTYLSYKIQMEIDCKNYVSRVLGFIDYLNPMGEGEPVRTISIEQRWTPLRPTGEDKLIWDAACSTYLRT